MSRVGFLPNEETIEAIKKIASLPRIEIRGYLPILPPLTKRTRHSPMNNSNASCGYVPAWKMKECIFLSATAATAQPLWKCQRTIWIWCARVLSSMDAQPSSDVPMEKFEFRPVMSLRCCAAHIKLIDKGATVSYGRHFTCDQRRKIAVLPVGYADGYTRLLSGKVDELFHGHRVPQIGNICMDQCMIDITGEANCLIRR